MCSVLTGSDRKSLGVFILPRSKYWLLDLFKGFNLSLFLLEAGLGKMFPGGKMSKKELALTPMKEFSSFWFEWVKHTRVVFNINRTDFLSFQNSAKRATFQTLGLQCCFFPLIISIFYLRAEGLCRTTNCRRESWTHRM